jgi:hypothetical protein
MAFILFVLMDGQHFNQIVGEEREPIDSSRRLYRDDGSADRRNALKFCSATARDVGGSGFQSAMPRIMAAHFLTFV